MNEDSSQVPYRPEAFGQPVQHDAPTEMFSAPPPYAPGPVNPYNAQTPWTQPRPSIRPEQLIRPTPQRPSLPGPLPAKLKYLWNSDPAYKVLFVSISVVLICSICGIFLLSNAFSHASTPTSSQSTTDTSTTRSLTPTDNNKQANGVQATPQSTPTPLPTTTPTPVPTPTPAPAATPLQTATLTAQITDIPQTADNHSTISVTVASIPGATVWLTILVEASPAYTTTNQHIADGDGNVVIHWHINEHSFSGFFRQTIAQVTAHAEGANGQQVQSEPAQITINLAN